MKDPYRLFYRTLIKGRGSWNWELFKSRYGLFVQYYDRCVMLSVCLSNTSGYLMNRFIRDNNIEVLNEDNTRSRKE